jgi:hypothetical protein
MENKRIERLNLFEKFQNSELNFFEGKKANNKTYKKFDNYYSLCIAPKGRNGGVSKRLYEVFYGRRIYDIQEQIRSDFSTETKQLTETGCTLSFCLNDHGYVAVILYPGKTDYTRQTESCIYIENYLHPKQLFNKTFLKKQWSYLNSYMETTSIDGNPRILDKIRVFYLRYFKNKVIDKIYQEKPIINALLTSLKFILNIGLSGFLIYVLTVLPNIKTFKEIDIIKNEKDNLKIENEILKKETKHLKELDSLKNIINIKRASTKKS